VTPHISIFFLKAKTTPKQAKETLKKAIAKAAAAAASTAGSSSSSSLSSSSPHSVVALCLERPQALDSAFDDGTMHRLHQSQLPEVCLTFWRLSRTTSSTSGGGSSGGSGGGKSSSSGSVVHGFKELRREGREVVAMVNAMASKEIGLEFKVSE
jgi:hypothetical protein